MKIKSNKRPAIVLIAILFWTFPLIADSVIKKRVYREKIGKQVTNHRFTIETSPSGCNIDLTSETGDKKIFQTYRLDPQLDTQSWSYYDPQKNVKVNASRTGHTIRLKGTDRGKPVDKTFKINDLPWNQTFNIGLEQFAVSSKTSMVFWAIGAGGRGHLKITKFKVKKKKTETITLSRDNKPVEAVHITISLTGLLSIFWTGNYWYRTSDGRFLRYFGKTGMGSSYSLMELLPEE
jgi:hypothetical protein